LRFRVWACVSVVVGLMAAGGGVAHAQQSLVQPYATNDYGHFASIIPPGEGTNTSSLAGAAFLSGGTIPAHDNDQSAMYTDLLYATPGLKSSDLPKYFHDATFGVPGSDVAGTESPRSDVTIVRDKQLGIPHIYGATRSGTMFGAGYAAAEDRMFFMDVLRHYGQGELSSFAGGANRATDESQFAAAPYSKADLQTQFNNLSALYGSEGAQVQQDLADYAAGINAWINSAQLDPSKIPVEYAAIGQPQGPTAWNVTDTIAIGSLIGAQLGTGGGAELDQARLLALAQARFGPSLGFQVMQNLRSAEDPEAPLSIKGASFPYDQEPAHPTAGSAALPDAGSLAYSPVGVNGTGSAAKASAPPKLPTGGVLHFPTTDSNALLVSAADSASGHPLFVAGSQAAYFSPEIYLEEDVHGPGIDARGAALPGASMYVVIGHGRDYAWSATSASQDVVDTYAVDLCNPDGSAATKSSNSYLYHGQCLPMDTVSHTISWAPNAADQTAAGSETLQVQRTNYGNVYARGTVDGKPVAYTHLRTTYMHEIDSALGFYEYDNPDLIHNVGDFMHAAYKIGYTFNWLYADDRDIGMITTGAEPIRPAGVDGTLPIRAQPQFEWQGFNPAGNITNYVPFEQRPQVVNQDMIFSWNTKQARGFATSEPRTPVWRSQLLEERLRATLARKRKLALTDVIDGMAGAATADLRGDQLLPWLLKVIGHPSDPAVAKAVNELQAWYDAGSPRLDSKRSGSYDHADAVKLMDAWLHPLQQAVFQPALGKDLYDYFAKDLLAGEDTPNSFGLGAHSHLGSSWEQGSFGYIQKDLRTILAGSAAAPRKSLKPRRKRRAAHHKRSAHHAAAHGKKHNATKRKRPRRKRPAAVPTAAVQGRYAIKFCGGGDLAKCRQILIDTLRVAIATDASKLYGDDPTINGTNNKACGFMGLQECYDALRFRPIGLVGLPMIPWQNRPTQQQAVEVVGHRPR
jgi:acyl-homoserine lactone acylase PvdQ